MDSMSERCLVEDRCRSMLTRIGRIFWTEKIMTGSPSVKKYPSEEKSRK